MQQMGINTDEKRRNKNLQKELAEVRSQYCDEVRTTSDLFRQHVEQQKVTSNLVATLALKQKKIDLLADVLFRLYKEKGFNDYDSKYWVLYHSEEWQGLLNHAQIVNPPDVKSEQETTITPVEKEA